LVLRPDDGLVAVYVRIMDEALRAGCSYGDVIPTS
jgi:hypothetical protein